MTMEQPFFPVQRSILSAPALAERVLSRFELPGPAVCPFLQRGINDAYLVETQGDRFILRQIWLLGISAKNMPNYGLSPFREWCFNRCMPIVRSWMAEPWY